MIMTPLAMMLTLPCLASCSSSSLEKKTDTIENIKKCIKGEGVELQKIILNKNNSPFYFIKEAFENEMIAIYKYELKDNNQKYLYSYNDKNSFNFDYETNSYLVYGIVDGVYGSYSCSYVGEIGCLSSSCKIKLYEESNFVEIEINNKKNVSLNNDDYQTIIDNEIVQKVNEKENLINTINSQSNQLSLCATYTFYIDLNSFDSYEYNIIDNNESVCKDVVKQGRTGEYSSSYFSCFGDGNVTYILGGKNNALEVNKFTNGADEKYIPLSTTIKTISINNESYEKSSEYLGEVLMEVNPSIDFDKCICNHLESNYSNLSMNEEDYLKFINQNIIQYSFKNKDYYIKTKEPVSYSESIEEYGSYVFINVQNY